MSLEWQMTDKKSLSCYHLPMNARSGGVPANNNPFNFYYVYPAQAYSFTKNCTMVGLRMSTWTFFRLFVQDRPRWAQRLLPRHLYDLFLQVSRCGMIYMEPSSMGWRPVFKSWLNVLPQTFTDLHKTIITELFDRFVDSSIRTVRKAIEVGR